MITIGSFRVACLNGHGALLEAVEFECIGITMYLQSCDLNTPDIGLFRVRSLSW